MENNKSNKNNDLFKKKDDDSFNIMLDLLNKKDWNLEYVKLLKENNIYGENLCKLYKCVHCSTDILAETLDIIKEGYFSAEQVFQTFEEKYSIKFESNKKKLLTRKSTLR